MARLAELCPDLPVCMQLAQSSPIWDFMGVAVCTDNRTAMHEARKDVHRDALPLHEGSCFNSCREKQGIRKRVRANCTPRTGNIVMAIRVGEYTRCVCKHRM